MRNISKALAVLMLTSAQSVASAGPDDPPEFFGPGIGWLKTICDDQGKGSQGACVGAVWTVIQHLAYHENKICIPMDTTEVFSAAYSAIDDAVKAGKDGLTTPYYDEIAVALLKAFPC
jgi:hypothetical protein